MLNRLLLALSFLAAAAALQAKAPDNAAQQTKKAVLALRRAVKQRQSIDKIRAAAKTLEDAVKKHCNHPQLTDKPAYADKAKACQDAIQRVIAADSPRKADIAYRAVPRTCVGCHQAFKR